MRTDRLPEVALMPSDDISLTLLLFRYWWPFWLFQDASRGDKYARAAAYRHNREKRIYLPGYLVKWLFIGALALALMAGFELLSKEIGALREIFIWLAAGSGGGLTFVICLLLKTTYIYLYLSKHEY